MDFNTTGHKQRKGKADGLGGLGWQGCGGGVGGWGVAGRVWGGGIEGRAGEEDGVHRDPLNKPRVP